MSFGIPYEWLVSFLVDTLKIEVNSPHLTVPANIQLKPQSSAVIQGFELTVMDNIGKLIFFN